MITSIEYIEQGVLLYGITLIVLCISNLYLLYSVVSLRNKLERKNKK